MGNLKTFGLESYINGFKTLAVTTVYSFYDTDDQLDTLNKSILTAINKHAPLFRVKLTRPPASCMKDIKVNHLQRKRGHSRHEVHKNSKNENWRIFRDVRNEVRKKLSFTGSVKKIWKVIHCIFSPD